MRFTVLDPSFQAKMRQKCIDVSKLGRRRGLRESRVECSLTRVNGEWSLVAFCSIFRGLNKTVLKYHPKQRVVFEEML